MATRGYGAPEVEHTYARARALCQQVEDTPQLAQVLFGLWVFYFVRAEYQTAQELAEHVLTLAHRVQVPALLLAAHGGLAQTLFCLGELAQARALFERGLAYHDPQQHRALALVYGTDPAVFSLSWLAWSLWLLGYPDQATQQNCAALTFAHALGHALTLGSAQAWAAIFHALGRDAHATQAQAEAAMTLATEQGVPLRWAEGVLLHGWALVVRGRTEEGIAQLRQGMAAWRATGAEIAWPLWLAILAEAYGKAGHAGEEQTALTEALAHVNKTGERFWEAEIHRLQGEWLLSQGTGPGSVPTAAPERSIMAEAEACFARALDIARHQQAKSLELRASMSLARLWQQQGKRPAAHALLAPIYGWFTEGFDTADLQEARALVEELA
jgi:predicted ATPase